MLLGEKIKTTRLERGITLRKLAKEVGVSPSFISQVEQNKAKPSIQSLQLIAKVLEVSSSYLVGEEATTTAENPIKIQNKFDPMKMNKVIIKKLVPDSLSGNNLEPNLLTVEPGATSEELSQMSGEEFLLLLSGQLDISLNDKNYTLKEGDNIYFNSAVKHKISNSAQQAAKVLWIKGS